jgi:hypothetical protein
MKRLLFIILLSVSTSLNAQNILSLYNMRHIPQVVYANPAFIPLGRVNVSIPGLGSTYAQIGKSNFVTKDVANVDASGTLRLDVDKFLEGLEDENILYAGASAELIHIGFSAGKNYFFMGSTDKITGEFAFPKSLAVLISEVYEAKGIEGFKTINDTKGQYSHVRQYSFGWARRINKDLNIGVNFKYLTGIMNVRTNSSGIVINGVTPDNELSGLIDINMETSGITEYKDLGKPLDFLLAPAGYDNHGIALDFGIDYRINQKFKVSASVLDLMGTITWNDNVRNYVADSVRVDFNTVDWASVIAPKDGDGLTGIYDSIIANIDPSLAGKSFQTIIPTKVLGSFTYYLTPKIEATIISQGILYDGEVETKLRIGIQGRVKRFLNYMISYAVIDSQEEAANLGVGIAMNFGPIQIHALTDNIFDPLLFSSEFNPSLRFGINLTMGRDFQ